PCDGGIRPAPASGGLRAQAVARICRMLEAGADEVKRAAHLGRVRTLVRAFSGGLVSSSLTRTRPGTKRGTAGPVPPTEKYRNPCNFQHFYAMGGCLQAQL